jgi:adenylate cyclase
MRDRVINILIVESEPYLAEQLLTILSNPNYNIFTASNSYEALRLINTKNFVVVIASLDIPGFDATEVAKLLHSKPETQNVSVVFTSKDEEKIASALQLQTIGIIDYLIHPYKAALVRVKIDTYKKFYIKHTRIKRLLQSILPEKTINEFGEFGKSSPKRHKHCSILFTDFVDFTKKTKNTAPNIIVQSLDYYFSKFDEIMLKYKLEKIKTIGDAYMAVGGVTEKEDHVNLRTALAALEIRDFIRHENEINTDQEEQKWKIRIGIHTGDLVAGVVGKSKFSFDVWGNAVNIAARCEQLSTTNEINVSADFYHYVKPYIDAKPRGPLEVKNAGEIEMYYLLDLKKKYSHLNDGKRPNLWLREQMGLPLADFDGLRTFILDKLEKELDERLIYHSVEHTIRVEDAVIKYGKLEKVNDHELFLLRTAALFHDSGFLERYENNETIGVENLRYYGPKYGYSEQDLTRIEEIILSTVHGRNPKNLLCEIMCDADLDYLGRLDYHVTAKNLFDEMAHFGQNYSEKERLTMQISFLEEEHEYYTISARNLRNPGKLKRLQEVKKKFAQLNT